MATVLSIVVIDKKDIEDLVEKIDDPDVLIVVQAIIKAKTEIDECKERIKKRGRERLSKESGHLQNYTGKCAGNNESTSKTDTEKL